VCRQHRFAHRRDCRRKILAGYGRVKVEETLLGLCLVLLATPRRQLYQAHGHLCQARECSVKCSVTVADILRARRQRWTAPHRQRPRQSARVIPETEARRRRLRWSWISLCLVSVFPGPCVHSEGESSRSSSVRLLLPLRALHARDSAWMNRFLQSQCGMSTADCLSGHVRKRQRRSN
jgi:hypothetical protein